MKLGQGILMLLHAPLYLTALGVIGHPSPSQTAVIGLVLVTVSVLGFWSGLMQRR